MEEVQTFLASYGYGALFLLGIAEFAALPVATIPVLLAVGALAAGGTFSVVGAVLAVAAGGLLADTAWMTVARWRGHRIVSAACGLSANPGTCVLTVCERITQFGAPYLLLGKFIPGTAPMLAAAAGLAGVRHSRFLVVDAAALLLWAATYVAVGWFFSDQLTPALRWTVSHGRGVAVLFVSGMTVALLARAAKTRIHRRHHAQAALNR